MSTDTRKLASDIALVGGYLAGWIREASENDIGFEINPYDCVITCDRELDGTLGTIGISHDSFAAATGWFIEHLGVGAAAVVEEKGETTVTFKLISGPYIRLSKLVAPDHPDTRQHAAV